MSELVQLSQKIRSNVLELSHKAKSAHVGSSLSCVEILCSIFWLKYKAEFPISKFVLSKGHAAMGLYSTALEYGLLKASDLERYLGDETRLWGHPSVTKGFDFIYWSTGSLGHGLPACVGFAYAEKYLNSPQKDELVVAVVSDGELDEGTNWESFLFSSHHKLDNLLVIIDYNKIQSFGRCDEIIGLEPLMDKIKSFGYDCLRMEGHDPDKMVEAIQSMKTSNGKPKCIIADTVKGKGVPDIEDTLASHYKPITQEQLKRFQQ